MSQADSTHPPITLGHEVERDALGTVYRAATRRGHGAPLWVRLLDGEPFDRPRFWRQAPPAALGDLPERAAFGHRPPGVIGALGEVPYLAYALPNGGLSLGRLLRLGTERERQLPEKLALYITRELNRALRTSPALDHSAGHRAPRGFISHGFLVPQLVWIADSGRVLLLGSEIARPLRACLEDPSFRAAFQRWVRPGATEEVRPHPSQDLFALGSLLRQMLAVSLFPGDRPTPAEPWLRPFLVAGLATAGGGEGQLDELEQRLDDAMAEAGYRVEALDLASHVAELHRHRPAAEGTNREPTEPDLRRGDHFELDDRADETPPPETRTPAEPSDRRPPEPHFAFDDALPPQTEDAPLTALPQGSAPGWSASDDGAPPEAASAEPPPPPAPGTVPPPPDGARSGLPRIPRRALYLAAGLAVVVFAATAAHLALDAVIPAPQPPGSPDRALEPAAEPAPGAGAAALETDSVAPQTDAAGDARTAAGEELPPSGPSSAGPEIASPRAPIGPPESGSATPTARLRQTSPSRAAREPRPEPSRRGSSSAATTPAPSQVGPPAMPAAPAPIAPEPAPTPEPALRSASEDDHTAATTAETTTTEDDAPAARPATLDTPPGRLPASTIRPPESQPTTRNAELLPPDQIDTAPQLRRRPQIEYPPVALRLGEEATLLFRVLVDRRGRVIDVVPASERAGFGFDEAAVAAARDARYEPATAGGEPVRAWTTLSVSYRLSDQGPPAPPEPG